MLCTGQSGNSLHALTQRGEEGNTEEFAHLSERVSVRNEREILIDSTDRI